jgi:magnesium transporter
MMAEPAQDSRQQDNVHEALREVVEMLDKHELVEKLVHNQEMQKHELVEQLVHKQNLVSLQKILEGLHPADVAYILEALPLPRRLMVWDLVKAERDGEILLEVSDAVRETLIANMDPAELVAAAEQLDTDEIADLAPDLPQDVVQDVLESLDVQNRARLQSALAYKEGTVGALMDFEMVTVREDVELEVVLRYLRRLDELPSHTDKLFVVDRHDIVRGVLPLRKLLVNDADKMVADVLAKEIVSFRASDDAREVALAFERYNLISAPVVSAEGKLVGRLTVEAVMDFNREQAEAEARKLAGLREDEDLFSSAWKSAQNRAPWLAINLVTAFIASRVIGAFEGSIEKLAALAALMPIVAGIGGNSGNQTSTLIVRGLALGQITAAGARKLMLKELAVSLLNGLVWGSVLGFIAYLLYGNFPLGVVMMGAMLLNLLLAAVVGTVLPLIMHRIGQDPAVGTSVLLTATTDSMGFLIFLGLATLFLLR